MLFWILIRCPAMARETSSMWLIVSPWFRIGPGHVLVRRTSPSVVPACAISIGSCPGCSAFAVVGQLSAGGRVRDRGAGAAQKEACKGVSMDTHVLLLPCMVARNAPLYPRLETITKQLRFSAEIAGTSSVSRTDRALKEHVEPKRRQQGVTHADMEQLVAECSFGRPEQTWGHWQAVGRRLFDQRAQLSCSPPAEEGNSLRLF